MILVDTSGLLAALFIDQRRHADCAQVVTEAEGPLVLSPFVLAELDYLVTKLAGEAVERELLAEVARGAYQLAEVDARDVEEARGVIERHEGLGIGLADAMTVVLSRRLWCLDVLTLDERHFRVLRGFKNRPFRVLPADV
ncbi:MAG: PIN domain-containing protein [Thermoanaerobaculales bacterium]|jgi:predicted nucleic acid-binding protein|nr:PIN domain-containing protein [Thermoanaerobaculales bacterium]